MEVLYEIYLSIRQNKTRTFLSGFGISWGVLILVVLLGTGKGFQNSVMNIFSTFAQKSMYVYGGTTSVKYKNIREGEQLHFDLHFLGHMKKHFPGIKAISPEITGAYSRVMNKDKSGFFKIMGVNEDYMRIKILKINKEGRYFNKGDEANARNVVIIGENVSTTLFGGREALGKSVNIAGIDFRVIGIRKAVGANPRIYSSADVDGGCYNNGNFRHHRIDGRRGYP